MKILISSYRFRPSVGGIETISEMLAEAFARVGHAVRLVTWTPLNQAERKSPYRVYRRPGMVKLFQLVTWSDIFFQNNLSLTTGWPNLILGKPLVVAHQTWLNPDKGIAGFRGFLEKRLLRAARHIAISEAIAKALPLPAIILGNPYNENLFGKENHKERNRDLVCLGRLVSDKGVDLLLEAMARLRERALTPSLTIIGEGPERKRLEDLVKKRHLRDQVAFAGLITGTDLARELGAHAIMVVPSRWREPFGIVALEGIACGCVIVGSEEGGLKEAIGPCGRVFPNGDVDALTDILAELLSGPSAGKDFREKAEDHLRKFRLSNIAPRYLEIFREAIGNSVKGFQKPR